MNSQMNHKDSSIQAFGKVVRYPALRGLLTGLLFLLAVPGFSMNDPVISATAGGACPYNITLISSVNNQVADGSSEDDIQLQVTDPVTGLPVQGVIVSFEIAGTFVISQLTTDVNGEVTYSLASASVGATDINVTMCGTTVPNSPFSFNFIAGPPSTANPSTQLIVVTPVAPPDGSTATVVEAEIFDAFGNPVSGATVNFTISGGTAAGTAVVSPGLSVVTNASGIATINITNLKAGTVIFTATVNGSAIVTGSPATVTFIATTPSVTNPLTELIVTVPTSPPDGSTQDVIEAQIVDANGNPVPNASVVFTMIGGTAAGTAVTTPLAVTTNANGIATIDITNTKAGTVTFTATVNGLSITNGSPATVNFVATTPSVTNPATELIVTVPTSPPDGATADQVEAQIVDANGNPVANATVVFTITGGTAAGSAVTSSLTVTTNANGIATINITNLVSGTVIFTATVNGLSITNGSPATVNFVATTPSSTGSQLVVVTTNSPADGATPDVIEAIIVDANGNPVPNATVVFTITGGTATGNAQVAGGLTVTTNANGLCNINITDITAGTVIFTATANGVPVSTGSPATVTFVATAPSTSNPNTQLVVDVPSSPPDGTTADVLHAHIVDANGNVVANQTVVFTISGGTAAGTAVVTTTLTVTTDASGNATIDVTNMVVGTVTFTATVNGSPITNGSPATVNFVYPPPSTSNPLTELVVDVTGSPADGVTPNTIHAQVVDANGNPVPNATVVFTITGGTAAANANVVGGFTVTTNASGDAAINITDITAGTVVFTATVNGAQITNNSPATVTFVAGAPSATGGKTQLTIIVDNSVANGTSTDSLQALITDVNGNPVANTTVTFLIESGGTAGGTAVFMETVTATTNASGIATIGVSNTLAGTVEIGAQIGGTDITGSPALITFVNAPDVNNPATQLIVIVYEALADGTSTTVVKAHIVDQNGQPISDRSIVFTVDSGTAQITTPQPVMTDNNGDALISLTSTTTGYVLITATVDGTPIIFGSPARVHFAAINIYVPKVFTPNADGTNDVLKPILVGIATFHYFTVYNRWGNIIFTTQDPNQGWDGTFKGVSQPVETYLWIAEGITTEGKKIVQKGMTSLVR
jgi:gliding motility-associated-like protein